jgi:hypothetical protein
LDLILEKNDRRLPGCVNWDGTAQKEAIPDEWGQAAFVSALVEGLAGIVDRDVLFREVEISPRWYFADIHTMEITVGYSENGSQVSYRYKYDPAEKSMYLETSGKFETFIARLPVPENAEISGATQNGTEVAVEIEKINRSEYAVIRGSGSGNIIEVQYQ